MSKRFITQSELKTWRRCRRQWWLGTYRKLQMKPELTSASAASLGTLVHKALEDPSVWRETLQAELEYAQEIYEEQPDRLEEYGKQIVLATIMVEGYLEWLEDEGADQWIEHLESEARVEVKFADYGDVEVWLLGKLDSLIRDLYDDTLGFIDFKTVGSLGDIPKHAPRDEQFLHYTLLLMLLHPESERPAGGVWRQLRKVKRTARSTPPFYGEHRARFNAEQLESYRKRVGFLVGEILQAEAALASGADPLVIMPPTPTRDCSWQCDFKDVCPMFDNGDRVEAFIEDWYVEGDPLARYAEQEEGE